MGHDGMICQACGVEAPTRDVAFYQNIGLLVMRLHKGVKGELCKRCIHRHFWSTTLTTLFLGWWGLISLVVTPIFILNNIVHYLLCITLPAKPAEAAAPVLTDEAIERLKPHAEELFACLERGMELDEVAPAVAKHAGVTPGQVVQFVVAVAAHAKAQQSVAAGAEA